MGLLVGGDGRSCAHDEVDPTGGRVGEVPRLDVEGEGLAHEVALRDWPEPNSDYRVYGRGIGVYSGDRGFARVDISLLPGQILVASGDSRRALLLAVSGRVGLTAGEMKIGEMVLPEHAGKVRRTVPFYDLGEGGTPPPGGPEIARLRRDAPALLVIDGAEALTRSEESVKDRAKQDGLSIAKLR